MDGPPTASAPARQEPMPAGAAAWLVSGRAVAVAIAAAVLTLIVFRLFPGLDLATSELFYRGQNRFAAATPSGEVLRRIFSSVPTVIVLVMIGLRVARRLGAGKVWAPTWRGLAFVIVSLILGPGLLVNVVLKDHSHRPRPVQTEVFGGALAFRPVGSFDGACARNCSFVSGEGSWSFSTLAPALLAPASFQPAALMAALCFGAAASLLRLAFGGHYLSDTIMAALLVWLVTAGTWWAIMRARGPSRPCRRVPSDNPLSDR